MADKLKKINSILYAGGIDNFQVELTADGFNLYAFSGSTVFCLSIDDTHISLLKSTDGWTTHTVVWQK